MTTTATARRHHVHAFFAGRAMVTANERDVVRVSGLAVPWNTTATLNYWGDTFELAPGSLELHGTDARQIPLLLDHRMTPFGYGVAFESTDAGLMATFEVPRAELEHPDVARAVRQMGNGVRTGLSIGAELTAWEAGEGKDRWSEHLRVTAGQLLEVSSVVIPRFAGARHAPVAAGALDVFGAYRAAAGADDDDDEAELEDGAELEHEADDEDQADAELEDGPGDDDDDDDDDDGTAGDEHDQEGSMTTTATAGDRREQHRRTTRSTSSTTAAPTRFGSLGAFTLAAAAGQVTPDQLRMVHAQMIQAADLVDQLTTDVPGLMPEAWVSDLIDLMGAVSPTIAAFSSRPLPDAGMVVNQPVVVQGPDVDVQAAEKGDIATRKVLINPVPFPVLTYAGGQDVSIQTILRSEPEYLTELMRMFAREMALQLNMAFARQVGIGATAGPAWPATDAEINGAFVDAAAQLLAATLSFPQVVLLSVPAWQAMANAVGTDGRPLFPTMSPVNPVGSVDLSSPDGNVRGLTYMVEPSLGPAATAIVGLTDAARSYVGAVGTLTADVPQKLGRDVAVYRFAAHGVTDARGLVRIGAAPVAAAADAPTSSSSSKGK